MQPSSSASIATECHAVTVPYYSQQNHGPFETFALGDFDLESGDRLRGASLAYATFGTLAADGRNAILFPSWYSGTSKILELAYIGPGRPSTPTNTSSSSSTRSATACRRRLPTHRCRSTPRAFRASPLATTCARSTV
jgi:hypothetical protein